MKCGSLTPIGIYCLALLAWVLTGCDRTNRETSPAPSIYQGDWNVVYTSIQRGNYDAAAKAAVDGLSPEKPDLNRQYVMWKWWEHVFGDRTDYHAISEKFGTALFAEYDRSSRQRRKIIAEIFGKSDFDLNKSGADLRKLVESK